MSSVEGDFFSLKFRGFSMKTGFRIRSLKYTVKIVLSILQTIEIRKLILPQIYLLLINSYIHTHLPTQPSRVLFEIYPVLFKWISPGHNIRQCANFSMFLLLIVFYVINITENRSNHDNHLSFIKRSK